MERERGRFLNFSVQFLIIGKRGEEARREKQLSMHKEGRKKKIRTTRDQNKMQMRPKQKGRKADMNFFACITESQRKILHCNT